MLIRRLELTNEVQQTNLQEIQMFCHYCYIRLRCSPTKLMIKTRKIYVLIMIQPPLLVQIPTVNFSYDYLLLSLRSNPYLLGHLDIVIFCCYIVWFIQACPLPLSQITLVLSWCGQFVGWSIRIASRCFPIFYMLRYSSFDVCSVYPKGSSPTHEKGKRKKGQREKKKFQVLKAEAP